MRITFTLIAAILMAVSVPAFAEFENVTVGGEIIISGNMYDYGDAAEFSYYEQRTKVNVDAEFTDGVRAFIELDSHDQWGNGTFRSEWVTGEDFAGAADIALYQGYIEANDMYDTPVRLRIGRQEIILGSEWLVGNNDSYNTEPGLSFDAIRLTYATDTMSLDLWSAKLAENFGDFGDDDIDFYGVYFSYTAVEDWVFDLYWLFINEDDGARGVDADVHTIGARAAGQVGAFDLEGEIAFQLGDYDTVLADTDVDAWAANLEAGYTFDCSYQPRVYLGYAFFEGGEDDDLPFNRLFSDTQYSEFLGFSTLSNVHLIRGGISACPTESVEVALLAIYMIADEDRVIDVVLDESSDEDLGLELGLYVSYAYSEDLSFGAGWAHMFVDDGVEDDNFVLSHGTELIGVGDDDDFDYLFFETRVKF